MSDSASNSKSSATDERTGVSVIVVWGKDNFHMLGGKCGGGKAAMLKLLAAISQCQKSSHCITEQESQSSLDGNQARKDLVFKTETEARKFNLEVINTVKMPAHVRIKTFRFTEAELGLKLEPVLTEQEILNLFLLDFQSARDNFFRHFVTCKVFMENQKILFRFANVSDVNLFLFHVGKRTLGLVKETKEPYQLLPDSEGMFGLLVSEGLLPSKLFECKDNKDTVDWVSFGEKFGFMSDKVDGSSNRHLKFENKFDLYTFFASSEAKACKTLRLMKENIFEGLDNLELCLDEAKAEEQKLNSELVAVEKELLDAKLILAKKEAILQSQNSIIRELRAELRAKKANKN